MTGAAVRGGSPAEDEVNYPGGRLAAAVIIIVNFLVTGR